MNGTEGSNELVENDSADASRVSTARWVLANCKADTPVYRAASRVIAAFLVGKPLPSPKDPEDLTAAEV